MKILINLIGGQPAPVYIAIRLINPEIAVLVHTEDSRNQLINIKNTLSGYKYDETEVLPFDFSDCYKKIKSVIEKYSDEENEIILNLTSGTTIMTLASYKAFEELKKEIIYIDSQNHDIIKIYNDNTSHSLKINLIFGLKDYFNLHGYQIETENNRFPDSEEFRKIRELCSRYYMQLKNLVSEVNKMIKENKNVIETTDTTGQFYFRFNRKKLKGILIITQGREKIELEITNYEIVDYITGYWFEDYIFHSLNTENIFDEILKNIKVYVINNNLQREFINELDIVGIKNQTLYIFECKTGNLDTAIIDKLRLIKSFTGRYSKVYLISLFNPINNSVRERINEFKIPLILFRDIQKFVKELKSEIEHNPNL